MNEAERRQALLWAEREGLSRLIASRPKDKAFIDDLKRESGFGDLSDAEALQGNIEQCLEIVLNIVRASSDDWVILSTSKIRITLYESDVVAATSETFSDGSCLIRVSDGLLSLCRNFSDLNHLWLGRGKFARAINLWKHGTRAMRQLDPMSTSPAVVAGTAAVRYYILHQRTWGTSSIIGSPISRLDAAGESFAQLALLFIVAHEVGHFLLRHPSRQPSAAGLDATAAHEWEYAADAFALECIASIASDDKHSEGVSLLAAYLALLAVSMAEKTLYLRPPESHPSFLSRWTNLAGSSSKAVEAATTFAGVTRMVTDASNMNRRLEKGVWDSLAESPLETDIHDLGYYTLVRGIDMALDHPATEYERLLGTFVEDGAADLREGLHQIMSGKLLEGLQKWEVKRAESLIDPKRPLTYHALLNSLVRSPVWQSATAEYRNTDARKRIVAILCINQICSQFLGDQ